EMIEEPAQINLSDLKKVDLSQKISGWVSNNLKLLIHKFGLKDKVMKFDKNFAKKHILETFLLANSENFILKKGVVKQLGGKEVVLLS
ncbi:22922_t:CDS:2, partial [Cetraspora pellucida]